MQVDKIPTLMITLVTVVLLFSLPTAEAAQLNQFLAESQLSKPDPQDLIHLKKFYRKAHTWGLFRRIKKMSPERYDGIVSLHEKYGLKTNYLTVAKELTEQEPKPKHKVRKRLNRESFWQTELQSFLIKNQVIDYTPRKSARWTPNGVQFQF